MRRGFLVTAVVFLGFAGAMLFRLRAARWAPQADFDVIGMLWVLSNLPLLLAWFLTLCFALLAVYCFLIGLGWVRPRLARLSTRSEESRMAADPRFWPPPRS
ncbi:MAG: hypothetical protein ACRELD_06810 [Longimicrobiales bacterium]